MDLPVAAGHTGVTGSWLFHCPGLGIITAGTVDQATAAATPYRLMPRLLDVLRREMSHETPSRWGTRAGPLRHTGTNLAAPVRLIDVIAPGRPPRHAARERRRG